MQGLHGFAMCRDNREDCFAFCRSGECSALSYSDFGDRKCPFYREREEMRKERELYDNGKAVFY